MRIEPFSLEHREIFEPRFLKMGLDLSDYSFSNLYLFRKVHQLEVVFSKDIYIKGKTRDGLNYLMPTAPFEVSICPICLNA